MDNKLLFILIRVP